jgi:hypothetical protein
MKNNLHKLDWSMFTSSEKDKVTIEHILPQKADKDYWRDMFSDYDENEIKQLSSSLGNLLPLSQSINSSLQNDSFPEKKNPSTGRRGYINGSHSEIEVAQKKDWTAEEIQKRGMKMLGFMVRRWNIKLSKNQKEALLHIDFVIESFFEPRKARVIKRINFKKDKK